MLPNNNAADFCLFVDESGGFVEAATGNVRSSTSQAAPSQVVGILAPFRPDILQVARKIMGRALTSAKLPVDKPIHGADLSSFVLTTLVSDLLSSLKENKWRPVRLVNEEGVGYGSNREINQTNIFAELVLRMFRDKARQTSGLITIRPRIDRIAMGPRQKNGYLPYMKQAAFMTRFREHWGFGVVENGLTDDQKNWHLRIDKDLFRDGELFGSAKTDPELQICDLLSNLTWNSWKKCSSHKVKTTLQGMFGDYDQTMKTHDVIERVKDLVQRSSSYGMAVIALAQTLHASNSEDSLPPFQNHLNHILDRLVQIGARARDAQLNFIISWLDQIVGQQRLIQPGYEITTWLQKSVVKPLRGKLKFSSQDSTIDWFDFAVKRWALTAANHGGKLSQAKDIIREMDHLRPELASRSEHIPLLMDGFIAQSVHQTDCFEFKEAIRRMTWIADSLEQQSKLLKSLMSDDDIGSIRYDLKAKALGTLTHSLVLDGLKDENSKSTARKISDAAIGEFVSADDKARQYQYRCHLETVCGDFAAARSFLLSSLGSSNQPKRATHVALIEKIKKEGKRGAFNFRFSLAHWLRIGSAAFLAGDEPEASDFAECFQRSGFAESAWCAGEISEFPVHIILRFVAVIEASQGRVTDAMMRLCSLQRITNENTSLTFKAIEIAAFADVAGVCWGTEESSVLLGNREARAENEPKQGIKQLIGRVTDSDLALFPSLSEKFKAWRIKIDLINMIDVAPSVARSKLLEIGRGVCY